jgi:hypothetical protein
VRWTLALAFVAAACGAPARAAPRLRSAAVEVVRAERPAPAPSLEERITAARGEIDGRGETLLAEHRERLDGEARIHLVLERGRCYRAWVGADGAFAAQIEDEHGHVIARSDVEAAAWIGEDALCPHWSGSFALVVQPRAPAWDLAVLLVAR